MNTIPTPVADSMESAEVYYPSSDGQPMAETGVHVWVMVRLISLLRQHYRSRTDVYVTGNIFLYYEEGHPDACRSPDVMVIKGVPSTPERDSFMIWKEKAVPAVVVEVTSKKTQDEDQGPKKELYEQLGVREYFLFDPKHDYLPRQLMGYRLIRTTDDHAGDNGDVTSAYEELPADQQGGLVSAELGLRLVPQAEDLALFDYRTGQRLLALQETAELAEQAERAAEQQRLRAERAEHTADEARRQREQAERTADEARRQREQAERTADEARRQREQADRAADEARRQREQAERAADEARRQREQADRAADEARRQREQADRAAEEQRQRAERAERAVEEAQLLRQQLEQELARLRALPHPAPPDEGF